MVKDTEEFARDTPTQDLLSHGYRTYYFFGAMIAAYRKLKYDKEVHFSAAILHDIGLTELRISPLTQCCFAVSGGHQALSRAKVTRPQSPNSWRRNFGTPQFAFACSQVRRGGFTGGERCRLRLVWFEKRKLSEKFKSDLLRAYPAGDLQAALRSNMAPGSRLDIGRKLSGRLPERIWIHDIK